MQLQLSDDVFDQYDVNMNSRLVIMREAMMMTTTMTKQRNPQRGVGRRDAGLAQRSSNYDQWPMGHHDDGDRDDHDNNDDALTQIVIPKL